MRRALPTPAEAAEILARKRTRPPRRPPPPVAKALGRQLKLWEERFGDASPNARVLTQNWREIVGEVLARRTEPIRLARPRRGAPAVLEIRVDGPAATLIQHQGPDVLARVNLLLGPGAVDRLRIIQGPVRAAPPPKAAADRPRRNLGPLDAEIEDRLARELADAPEGALKASLLRLGRAVARRTQETPD